MTDQADTCADRPSCWTAGADAGGAGTGDDEESWDTWPAHPAVIAARTSGTAALTIFACLVGVDEGLFGYRRMVDAVVAVGAATGGDGDWAGGTFRPPIPGR